MASTITFYTFVKKTPAFGARLDINFGHVARGNLLPLASDTQMTSDLEHSVGQPLQSFRALYSPYWYVNSTNGAAMFHGSFTSGLNTPYLWQSAGTNPNFTGQYTLNEPGTTGSLQVLVSSGGWTGIQGTTVTVSSRSGLPVEIRMIGEVSFTTNSADTETASIFPRSFRVNVFANGSQDSFSAFALSTSSESVCSGGFGFPVLTGTTYQSWPIDFTFQTPFYTSTAVEYDIRALSENDVATMTFSDLKVIAREAKNG